MYTKVKNPRSSNTDPTDPGATCNLLPSGAASVLVTKIVKNPSVETTAVALGAPELVPASPPLIAAARPAILLFGLAGTAMSTLFTRKVCPAVKLGLGSSEVIVPYVLA